MRSTWSIWALPSGLENVYTGGDVFRGPATVVEGIADATGFAQAVIGAKYG